MRVVGVPGSGRCAAFAAGRPRTELRARGEVGEGFFQLEGIHSERLFGKGVGRKELAGTRGKNVNGQARTVGIESC